MLKRKTLGIVVCGAFFVGAGALRADEPAPATSSQNAVAAPLAADASIDAILDALDQRGKTLREFVANIKMTQSDNAIGNDVVRIGRIWFQKKGEGDARLHLLLDKKVAKQGGSLVLVDSKIEFLLDQGNLIDRDYPKKTEVKRQVVKPGEKVDLLKLGKGPFPLPIGQSKEDVHANFEVSKAPPAKDDPADTVHLVLTPKAQSDIARRIRRLDVWVDRKSNMPVRIGSVEASGGEEQRTDLSNVIINPAGGIKDADFQLPDIANAGWSRDTEKFSG